MKALKKLVIGYLMFDVLLYTVIGIDYYISQTQKEYGDPELANYIIDAARAGKEAIKNRFKR